MGTDLRCGPDEHADSLGEDHPRPASVRPPPASAEGSLGQRPGNGTEVEQWQYEITAGRRIWHCIDDKTKTVWITDAQVGHPKSTE